MSSNIEIQKKCIYCQREYIAKTNSTKYCSHRCNQKHYKEVKRQEKLQPAIVTPIDDVADSKDEFLTITKSAILIGVSDRTIFRLIARGIIKTVKNRRSVLIHRNQLFKTTVYDNIDS